MIEAPVLVKPNNGNLTLRQVSLAEMISFGEEVWQKERSRLLKDLDDSNATSEERRLALSELQTKRGMAHEVMRYAFNLEYAHELISMVADPEVMNEIAKMKPDKVVECALMVMGCEIDVTGDDKEDPTTGKQSSSP